MKRIFSTNALVIGCCLAIYFILMDQLGFSDRIELRYFNLLILGAGLWISLHTQSKRGLRKGIRYFDGLKSGLSITFGAAVIFAAVFLIYTNFIGSPLIDTLHEHQIVPEYVKTWHLIGVIIVEGMASGFVMSYMLMQYYKRETKTYRSVKHVY